MNIKQKTFERALKMLDASGAKYHVVFDDASYGAPIQKARKRLPSKYKHGSLKEHMYSDISVLQPGEVAEISIGEFDKASIQSSATAISNKLFGAGNYTTHINGNVLELLRIE